MTERTCSVCGDGMRVPETLRWGWCMWCGCERRIAEALHGDGCDCDRCRTDIEETGSRCEACGAAPLGGPGDEAALCRDCARALREIERGSR